MTTNKPKYTGFKDRDGLKIYVGDIIHFKTVNFQFIVPVKYLNKTFCVGNLKNHVSLHKIFVLADLSVKKIS